MNQIVSLKFGGCKSLHTLYADCNQLGPLDLTSLPALRVVDLDNQKVATAEMLAAGGPR